MEQGAPKERWKMLAVLMGLLALSTAGAFGIGPLGPIIMAEMGISRGQFGLLSASFVVSGVLTSLGAGLLIDKVGVKPLILVGSLAMAVFLLALVAAPMHFLILFLLLFCSGLGYSIIVPLCNTGIVNWFPAHERGFVVGLKEGGLPLGRATVAVVLPGIALAIGWRGALAVTGAVIAVVGVVAYALYREGPHDPPGRRSRAPSGASRPAVSPWRLLRDPNLAWLYLVGAFSMIVQASLYAFLAPFLNEVFSVSAVQAGAFVGLSQVAGMIARPIAGLISDKVFHGSRKQTLCGTVFFSVCAALLLACVPPAPSGWLIGGLAVLIGLATLSWAAPFLTLVMEEAGKGLTGTASGMASTIMKGGILVGPPLFGYLVDFSSSYRFAIVSLAAGLALSGVLFSLFFKETRANVTEVGGEALMAAHK